MANGARANGDWRTSRGRIALWAVVVLTLLAPALAMRFTDQVAWGAEDFAFAAMLLTGGAMLFDLAARRLSRPRHRLIAGGVLALGVAIVWAQAAVGIF